MSDSESKDDDSQIKLAPHPSRAYSKRSHGAPLPFLEEMADGGDGILTEAETGPTQSVVVEGSLNSRFHGESSLFAFTNVLGEKWKFTSIHDLRSCRREFWETPEVFSSTRREPQADIFASG